MVRNLGLATSIAALGILAAGPVAPSPVGRPQCVLPPPPPPPEAGLRAPRSAIGLGGGAARAVRAPVGSIRMLVILGEFADIPHRIEPARFAAHLFGSGPTLRAFYEDVSGGRLQLDGDVHGWFPLPRTQRAYSDGTGGVGSGYPDNAQRMAEDAVAAAVAAGVDLGDYDADGDGVVDALLVIHSGEGYEWAGSSSPALTPFPDPDTINSHKWFVVDGDFGAGRPRVEDYFTGPELQRANPAFFPNWTDSIATLGVFSHEMGHVLGLPDFYDVQTAASRVGPWELMDAGTWSRIATDPVRSLPGAWPSDFSAWSKMFLGWTAPLVLAPPVGEIEASTLTLASTSGGAAPLQLLVNPRGVDWTGETPGSGEYFVAEVRSREGWDEGLPSEGLLIYHVDETRAGNRASDYVDRAGLMLLVPQDGDVSAGTAASATDAWPGPRTAFGTSTVPSSDLHDGTPSGVEIADIARRPNGAVVMDVVVSNLVSEVPLAFARPHPFRPALHGEVGLVLSLAAAPTATRVDLFDLHGRRLRTLDASAEFAVPGRVARWDGRANDGTPLPSGVYWFRADDGTGGKVVLLRD